MMSSKTLLAAALAVALLSACKKEAEAPAPADDAQAATEAPATGNEAAPEAEAPAADAAAAPAAPFDVSSIPISDKPLGDWPYLVLPEGYEYQEAKTLDLSRVPFWTGQGLEFVEGKVHMARVRAAGEKTYSRFEVLKRIDEALTALGASRITTSKIPSAVLEKDLPEDFGVEFNAGAGGYYGDEEVSTYLIRHADRLVWFKVYSDAGGGSILIDEAAPVAAAP